jgi:hypothetical protein
MHNGAPRSWISTASILGYLATALGASYVLADSFGSRDRQSSGSDAVIAVDQKKMFLAYVKRWKISSDLRPKNVSVGDILPDAGVRYYEIPLYYGVPSYRWSFVGEEAVIVEPQTRRVVELIN